MTLQHYLLFDVIDKSMFDKTIMFTMMEASYLGCTRFNHNAFA